MTVFGPSKDSYGLLHWVHLLIYAHSIELLVLDFKPKIALDDTSTE